MDKVELSPTVAVGKTTTENQSFTDPGSSSKKLSLALLSTTCIPLPEKYNCRTNPTVAVGKTTTENQSFTDPGSSSKKLSLALLSTTCIPLPEKYNCRTKLDFIH